VGCLCQDCRRFHGVANRYQFILGIAFRAMGVSLTNDVLGAVGKGLVNKIMAVAGRTRNGYKNISVFHKPRISAYPQRISRPDQGHQLFESHNVVLSF
jgi:hypothetical protein